MNAKGDANRSVRMTKRRLCDALIALLAQKPVREITVRELTALAKVSRGTFYFHYTDIYDLLAQIEQDQLEGLDALMGAILPSMDSQAPPEALLTLFVYLNEHEALCGALMGQNGGQRLRGQHRGLAAERPHPVAGGDVRHDLGRRAGHLGGGFRRVGMTAGKLTLC